MDESAGSRSLTGRIRRAVFRGRKGPSGGSLQDTVSSVTKNLTSLETVFHPVASEDPIVSDEDDRDSRKH